MQKLIFVLLLVQSTLLSSVSAQIHPAPDSKPEKYFPSQTQVIKLGDIQPLRETAPHLTDVKAPPEKTWTKRNYFKSNELKNNKALPEGGDPLVSYSRKTNPESTGDEISPDLNFEGLNDQSGISPPDPTGDVGLNHYVQMINASTGSWFQVWDKQGNSVYGPALTSTIWEQVQSSSIGDPIIQYDHAAQRWLMMEMQGFGENQLLVAISNDSDPTGGWKAYRVQCAGFPDYPKLYVWDNAYFITANEILETNKCSGYALDKAAMLAGADVINTYRFEFPNYMAIRYQPATGADWEAGPPPPPGSPGLIFRLYDDAWDGGSDQIQLWQIFVNWSNINQSYTLGPVSFNTTPFETRVCVGNGLFNCIEQPGFPTTPRITALENIIMYRAPYRNFGTYESIVLNHVTDISGETGDGGDAGIRWYEFRKNAGEPDWTIFQEGTHAPDQENRFMSTISQNGQGSIALGYTTASLITFPGIRVTGRRISNTPGTMPLAEYTIVPGGKSHFGDSRWGDYSNMAVDPVDDKTFWYVSEYQPANLPWGTRIGTFQIRRDSFDLSPTVVSSPVNASNLTNQQVTVQIFNGGLAEAANFTADLYINGFLIASDLITTPIASSDATTHIFQPQITWNGIGESKEIMVITRWIKDEFFANDTLRTVVKKLTSYDASLPGVAGLPNLICTADQDFGLILRNTAGLPLDSVQIKWRLNGSPESTIFWTGHLEPGKQDTVPFSITGLTLVQNQFNARVVLPNGQMDQDTTNDKIQKKMTTNLQGAFLTAKAITDIGILNYEIRSVNNALLAQGKFTPGERMEQICSSNSTCYKIILYSSTFKWEGAFYLYDLYGNLLFSKFEATPQSQTSNFCTPSRGQIDVGAFELLSPQTGPGLNGTEPVSIAVRNFGLTAQQDITVAWREENGSWNTETMTDNIPAGATKSYTFSTSTADLSTPGATKVLEIKATVTGDEKPANDSRTGSVTHKVQRDLALLEVQGTACYTPFKNTISLVVGNTGLSIVDSFECTYVLNGITEKFSIKNTGLSPGQQQKYIVELINGQIGLNQLSVNISGVNNAGNDLYEANDSQSTTFTIDADKVAIDLYMGLDESPEETSWELRYAGGGLVGEGGGYKEKEGAVFERFCVDKDSCLVFTLFDSENDGMGGSVVLQQNNSNFTIWSYYGVSDTFTTKIATSFCAATVCSGFTATFDVTPASTNTATDGKITVNGTGGTAPYRYSLNNMAPQTGNVFAGLAAGDYVVLVLDASDCQYYQLVTVAAPSGTHQETVLRELTVAPNPTKNLVWIKMPAQGTEQYADCTVYDASGKIVRKLQLSRFDQTLTGVCSLEKNPAGPYFVIVRQKNGLQLAEKRIQKIN